jgi:hypothetical protein
MMNILEFSLFGEQKPIAIGNVPRITIIIGSVFDRDRSNFVFPGSQISHILEMAMTRNPRAQAGE